MECKFIIGQKVVCIDNGGAARNWLIVNNTYTIEGFHEGVKGSLDPGIIFVTLVEIPATPDPDLGLFPVWLPQRFRPLNERKTDISIFTKLTKPKSKVKQRELEDV